MAEQLKLLRALVTCGLTCLSGASLAADRVLVHTDPVGNQQGLGELKELSFAELGALALASGWPMTGGASDLVYVPTTTNIAINSLVDVTVASANIANVVAGNQLVVEAHFTISNNSGATRVCVITLDFGPLFDIEITTAALATSATNAHPFFLRGVLDVRGIGLSYAVVTLEGQLAAGLASGGDSTMAATHLRGMGWATSVVNPTGTVPVTLKARSANATATQTLRLHQFSVRKIAPT